MYHKNIIKASILIIAILTTTAFAQPLYEENFSYTANDPLTSHGWTAHSGSGTNAIRVYAPGLTYAGYVASGVGNAAKVDTAGEDINKTFTTTNSGTVYTAFMLSVQKATTDGDYCFHLSTSPLNSYEYGSRFHVKNNTSGAIAFGLGKKHLDTSFTSFSYALNTTYLIVLKYQFVAGGDSNDALSMFVFTSGVPSTEPTTPTVGPFTPVGADFPHIGSVVLRQGTAARAPRIIIDGIRVGTSWNNAVAGIEENSGLLPRTNQLSLSVNPNPFTNSTNINFNINPHNVAKLLIYDVAGNLVQIIEKPASNRVSWNGRNANNDLVAPGVYFVTLETNKGNKTTKVLVSR
jgi:hypothetical protein